MSNLKYSVFNELECKYLNIHGDYVKKPYYFNFAGIAITKARRMVQDTHDTATIRNSYGKILFTVRGDGVGSTIVVNHSPRWVIHDRKGHHFNGVKFVNKDKPRTEYYTKEEIKDVMREKRIDAKNLYIGLYIGKKLLLHEEVTVQSNIHH